MENKQQISIIELGGIENLYICGDIHGEFAELVMNLERFEIKNSAVIILGDCGFGFEKPGHYPHIYKKKLEKKLDKYNNIILCIRGNHDDPRYYDDPEFIPDLLRIKTLPSNTILNVLDYNILCIGGAISIDRKDRIESNLKIKSNYPKCYWEDEKILYVEDIERIDCRVDIVLSHTAPISYDPPLLRDSRMDEELWEDILESRNYLERINSGIKPKRWYYGHFHKSLSGSTGCTIWRGLAEMEILEIPPKEKSILGKLED
jgi:predicted phosphodiesterase